MPCVALSNPGGEQQLKLLTVRATLETSERKWDVKRRERGISGGIWVTAGSFREMSILQMVCGQSLDRHSQKQTQEVCGQWSIAFINMNVSYAHSFRTTLSDLNNTTHSLKRKCESNRNRREKESPLVLLCYCFPLLSKQVLSETELWAISDSFHSSPFTCSKLWFGGKVKYLFNIYNVPGKCLLHCSCCLISFS